MTTPTNFWGNTQLPVPDTSNLQCGNRVGALRVEASAARLEALRLDYAAPDYDFTNDFVLGEYPFAGG